MTPIDERSGGSGRTPHRSPLERMQMPDDLSARPTPHANPLNREGMSSA